MSQTINIEQTDIVLANIGAATKTKLQLAADYPSAKQGQLVLSNTEIYQCIGSGSWKIYSELPTGIAYRQLDNQFGPTQGIENGGIKTAAPTGSERSDIRIGATKTSVAALEIDPYKFIPISDNGQLFKVPVLRTAAAPPPAPAPTAHEHSLGYGASQGPACTSIGYTTYYASEENLLVGTVLYTENTLTTPLSTAGYYSNGSVWYQVDGSGEIIATGSCDAYLLNTFLFNIDFNFPGDENATNVSVLSNFPPSFSNPGLGIGYGQIPVNGTSPNSEFELQFTFNGPQNVATSITLTDGLNDIVGSISGNGTEIITITFMIGPGKDRTFALKSGVSSLILFSTPL